MSATPIDKLSPAEVQQLAVSYAAFVLGDSGAKVNATTLQAVLDAAGIKADKVWVNAFSKTLQNRTVDSFCTGGASSGDAPQAEAPAAAAGKKDDKKKDQKKPEAKKEAPPPPPEEEEVDMGGLFDM